VAFDLSKISKSRPPTLLDLCQRRVGIGWRSRDRGLTEAEEVEIVGDPHGAEEIADTEDRRRAHRGPPPPHAGPELHEEAGLRNLEREIAAITRKVAKRRSRARAVGGGDGSAS